MFLLTGSSVSDDVEVEGGRSRRSTETKYLELMVVNDPEMFKFHGDDLQTYVMTAMNIVRTLHYSRYCMCASLLSVL